jgi:DNA-binding response OmpR family regulator
LQSSYTSVPLPAADSIVVGDTTGRGLVLIAEDERNIAELVRLYLTRDGFGVHIESDGSAVLAAVATVRPVALVLDIHLPGRDGLEICRTMRATGDATPILIVTARDDEVDRIIGLELGADDYITKPFSPRELVARLHAVLRRASPSPWSESVLVAGRVRLDPRRRTVTVVEPDPAGSAPRAAGTVTGREISLTVTEFDLLAALMGRPGMVHTREQLLSQVWGYAAYGGTRTVDVHVAQVRAKLGSASPIRTVRGVGYAADG